MEDKIISFNPSKRTQRDFAQSLRMPKDFVIFNNKHEIHCHSFIFFQAQIKKIENLVNQGIREFYITELIDNHILEKYIIYLYNDEVYEMTVENIIDLFKISVIFEDYFLKQQIEYFLSVNVNQFTIPILMFDMLKLNKTMKNNTFVKIIESIINYTKKKNTFNNQILSEKLLSHFVHVVDKDFSLSQLEDLVVLLSQCYGVSEGFKLILIDLFFTKNEKDINFNDIRNTGCLITSETKETVQNFIDKYVNINELDKESYEKYYKKYTDYSENEENEYMLKMFVHEITEKNKKLREVEELNNDFLRASKENILQHSTPSPKILQLTTSDGNSLNNSKYSAHQLKDHNELRNIILKKNLEIKGLLDDYELLNSKVSIMLEKLYSNEKKRYKEGFLTGGTENKRYSTMKNLERLIPMDSSITTTKAKKEASKHIGKYFEYSLFLKKKFQSHNGHVYCLHYNYINKTIISGGNDHCVKIWDITTGNCNDSLYGHNGYVYYIEQIKDYHNSFDTIIATASWDNTLKLWNVDASNCLTTLIGHKSSVRCCIHLKEFDRNAFASGDNLGDIILWNIGKGEVSKTFNAHEGAVHSLLFLKDLDSSFMVSSGEDTRIRLWDIQNKVCIETLIGHNNEVRSLIYLNAWESCLIASASDDTFIKIWNIDTEECEITLKGHTSYVRCLIYLKNVDEVTLISGGWDNLIKLWKVNRAQCIKTFDGISFVNAMLYLDDHEKITFATGDDETLKIWEVQVYQPTDLNKYL